ncbi:MAG: M15 family metallopeptidase, partial [Acidimicrobiia bacterium]
MAPAYSADHVMVRSGPARQLKKMPGATGRRPVLSHVASAVIVSLLASLLSLLDTPTAFADAEEHEEVLADRVSVSAPRGMTPSVVASIQNAAAGIGAQSSVVHSGTLELLSVRRGAQTNQAAPAGMSYPMSSLAVDPFTVRNVSPSAVASAIERGELVMSESSASVRGALAGDEVTIVGWNGGVYNLPIGLIAPDGEVGAELLWSTTVAKAVGFDRPSTVRVWGFASRDGVDASLLAGVPRGTFLRLRHSWDPIFPDDQIGQGRLKVLLGEFALARGRSGLVLESSWRAANIVRARLPIIGFVTCHRVVVAAATDALNEIAAAGLGGLINVSDTQRYGGCFNARELRTDTGTSGRNLSRHTWGGAIDINPSTNTFGGTPRIDQRIVQIFRDHGFIWGGSFSIPDGMHFEYIGERVVPT